MSGGRFASRVVQDKIDDLARRGQGRPGDVTIVRVAADLAGQVALAHSRLSLHGLRFAVPGVRIEAAGGYTLASEQLDFRGVALLDAGLSRTLTGARRVLLWPLDPLLRKDGAGTRVVVDIRGTKDDLTIDVDFGASLRGRQPR